MTVKPVKVSLRTYQVGFGDCFLLSVLYSDSKERHILIDFGSTGLPSFLKPADKKGWMRKVADDIKARCNGKLDIVIATHRHKDHISGFATDTSDETGQVIADCKPSLVIQPWTENPKLPLDAKAGNDLMSSDDVKKMSGKSFTASLENMHAVSASIVKEVKNLANNRKFSKTINTFLQKQIEFIADDNIKNLSAVKNLATMGEKTIYINYGYDLNSILKSILPAVKIKVLGPPTIEQHNEVKNETSVDKEEFWMLQAMTKNFWGMQSATSKLTGELIDGKTALFPNAQAYKTSVPSHDRWFVRQIRKIRAEQLLGIASSMDDAMNNTSLILLFRIGNKTLLFPGDAQIENWEYALKFAKDKDANLNLLKHTDLYKVGHHGSRNATPKSLWKAFENKKNTGADSKRVMKSVVSTMLGKHGDVRNHSEVPRETLVEALTAESDYTTTQELTGTEICLPDLIIEV